MIFKPAPDEIQTVTVEVRRGGACLTLTIRADLVDDLVAALQRARAGR